MKIIRSIAELKKGDTIIVKDHSKFSALGYARVFGDVFNIDLGKPIFTIRCKETNTLENISIENGKIFLIG